MAIHVVKEPVPKPGTLGRTELYALAIGQVIGAGVITLIVPAIKMTGYSAWLAYFVAILMGFVMILPFVFISSTLRLGGGNYSMLCDLSSPRTSGIFAYMYLTQCLSLSLFGASAAAYLGDIIPALNSHWARVIVGVTLLTFFYVVNLMGVDIMAKAQKVMTWLLIAALILFAIVGIFKMKLPMAAIDTACWDIKGKALGVPVYKLLGGKTNPKLRAYASQLQFGWSDLIQKDNKGEALGLLFDPKDYYEVTKNALRDGYDAIKVDPVFAPTDPDTPLEKIWGSQGTQIRGCYRQHDLQRSVERIAACREAGGPDMDIIVEIHSLLDANTAAELGKALEPLHIMYFEEPTSPENPSNFRHIKQKCDLPLATGERSYTRWGFRQFFEDRTLSVIQPDLCNTGGITETKKICDMAQVYDMGVQIHVCGGPIATAAALQVEAAIPNFTIHEEHNANLKNIFIQAGKYYYKPENGYYTVPDLPGIGQEMTDEFLATCRKVVIGG